VLKDLKTFVESHFKSEEDADEENESEEEVPVKKTKKSRKE
jgi:hypothetical protein